MKKLILIGLVALGVVCANAQVAHRSYSFLPSDVSSLLVSNTIAITNLLTSGATTNGAGTKYTNSSGVLVTAAGTKNLFVDVPLNTRRDGSIGYTLGSTNTPLETAAMYSDATLSVTWNTGSGANTACTLIICPLYDGEREAIAAAQLWSPTLTPTASSVNETVVTNVPLYKWPGAKALRIRRFTAGDTDASSQLQVSRIRLNQFVPQ